MTTKSPSVKAALAMLEYFAQNKEGYAEFAEKMTAEWRINVARKWRLEGVQIKFPRLAPMMEVIWCRENRVMVETIALYPDLRFCGAWSGLHR